MTCLLKKMRNFLSCTYKEASRIVFLYINAKATFTLLIQLVLTYKQVGKNCKQNVPKTRYLFCLLCNYDFPLLGNLAITFAILYFFFFAVFF